MDGSAGFGLTFDSLPYQRYEGKAQQRYLITREEEGQMTGGGAYDVVVVGARCAGSPLGMLLARAGHRVLIVDRSTFPSDTISTHFVQLSGIARLDRWGLLDDVLATGAPLITTGMIDYGAEPLEAETTMGTGLPGNLAPRRTVLDKVLVDGARAAGADVLEGFFVDSFTTDDGRVTGLEGRDAAGETASITARVVVGADGRNSTLARHVEAEAYQSVPSLSWGYYSYWSGVDCSGAEIYLHESRFTVAFPTNDGLTLVAVGFPMEEFEDIRKDVEERFASTLEEMGTLGKRVQAGAREEKIVGMRENPNFLRQPYGPGWALVGDAGYHKDPTPAHGISDAFRDAETLATALDDVLAGRSDEDDALSLWHQGRDEHARPALETTVKMSSFQVPPVERAQAFLELSTRQLEDLTPSVPG
jgi:2-polyprenyl-6-methoxyphenol hydroxylase-like FAD-dependent oxidoreductase